MRMFVAAVLAGCSLALCGCGSKSEDDATAANAARTAPNEADLFSIPAEPLPDGIIWQTNETDDEYASPDAIKGGTFRTMIMSFPLTFRTVGPDSNGSFRSFILDNSWSLIEIHPNTRNIIPQLATHWAFADDGKTMYFRLDPNARWSDGRPVTADDYAFTLEFMRSKHIVAPWYNDFYAKEIDRVVKYDDHTIAVVASKKTPDLHLTVGLRPIPRHVYVDLDENYVKTYNWLVEPNTGPYVLDTFKKGKHVIFKRKKNWWAADRRFYRHRFNADQIQVNVIRDLNVGWEHFKRGQLDSFGLTLPDYWHDKATGPPFSNGLVHKLCFYNDKPQPSYGFWLNLDIPLFQDTNVRYAFAHAVNIRKMIDTVLRGDYERLPNIYTGYGPYTDTTLKPRTFDIDAVTKLMTASGWKRGGDGIYEKEGQRFSVKITYGVAEHTDRLVVLKEEARKAGLEMVLHKLDSSASFKAVLEKKHEVSFHGMSAGLRPSPWQYFHSENAHKPQTNNFMNIDDPEMDQLVDSYRDSTVEAERIDLAKKIQNRLHEIGSYVPTYMIPYFRTAYWRYWRAPDVPGTRLSDALFDATDATRGGLFWFDPTLHAETEAAMKSDRTFPPVTLIDETYRVK